MNTKTALELKHGTQSDFFESLTSQEILYLKGVYGLKLHVGRFDIPYFNSKAPQGTSIFPTIKQREFSSRFHSKIESQFKSQINKNLAGLTPE